MSFILLEVSFELKSGALGDMLKQRCVDRAVALPPILACKSKKLHKMMGIAPSDIDKWSRILFPLSFFCFNLMYWIIYLHVSNEVASDLVYLDNIYE